MSSTEPRISAVQLGLFDCAAIRRLSRRSLRWHRLISVGRKRRVIDAGFAVTFYRTRSGAHVILDSQETEDSPFYEGQHG